MGIKNFSELFKPSGEIHISQLKNVDIAIDAFIQVFRNASKQYAAGLTNAKGENTLYINVALQNIVKGIRLGQDNIYVFDSRDPRHPDDPKQYILEERKEQREHHKDDLIKVDEQIKKFELLESKTTLEKILALDPNYSKKMEELRLKRSKLECEQECGRYFDPMVRNVQFILRCLGVKMATVPVGIDSEHGCAVLNNENYVDYVMTTDMDTNLYGAKKILKQKHKKTGKQLQAGEKQIKPGTYDIWILEDILKQHKIPATAEEKERPMTRDDLIKIGVILGCDFAAKTEGVGPGTILKKFAKIELTPNQIKAMEVFKAPLELKDIEMEEPPFTMEGINKLEKWLVEEQNFKAERIVKILEPIRQIFNKTPQLIESEDELGDF